MEKNSESKMTTLRLSGLINNEITDFIKTKVSTDLGIKPNTQVNANDVIPKIESLPFVNLSQMNVVRSVINIYSNDEIEESYPEIAKTLRNPNRKGYVANAMWKVLRGVVGNIYKLDDEEDPVINFNAFLADVDNYLMD